MTKREYPWDGMLDALAYVEAVQQDDKEAIDMVLAQGDPREMIGALGVMVLWLMDAPNVEGPTWTPENRQFLARVRHAALHSRGG